MQQTELKQSQKKIPKTIVENFKTWNLTLPETEARARSVSEYIKGIPEGVVRDERLEELRKAQEMFLGKKVLVKTEKGTPDRKGLVVNITGNVNGRMARAEKMTFSDRLKAAVMYKNEGTPVPVTLSRLQLIDK